MTSICILIAEDDIEDQFIMTDAFKEVEPDEQFVFVENGEMVINYLNEKCKINELPKLVVLDLNMPIMNGVETLRRLRNSKDTEALPIIVYSTSFNKVEIEECMRLGATSYITKPNTFTECKEVAKKFFSFCKDQYSFPSISQIIKQRS